MNVILKNTTIIDKESAFHNQKADIKIIDGIITKIGQNLTNEENLQVVELENLHVSQGWFDASVSFGEPGFEDRETIANGLTTAAKSGFTNVALQPNSLPVIDNQSQVSFVLNKANGFATQLHPIGAFTKNSEGNDLAEMFDMKNAGAIAFGDYNKNSDNANLLKIGLQYVQDFDGLVLAYCQDKTIKGNGVVHEGIVSTKLGLKGIPSLAEELEVARNLFLLEYTGGKMHIPTISTAKSVQLIQEAKAKGLNVTCSVAVHNLVLTDEVLTGFDTRYKVTPPLRDENHKKALIEGVLNGTIDFITSDHNPLDVEHKKMEFDNAKNGTIGLESAFGALQTILPTEIIVEKLINGKNVFGIEKQPIKEGNVASLTLFTTEGNWEFSKENILSKSKNSAFLGQPMKGHAYGIYNNRQLILN
ncbi:dihydroorotase-like cyclic amidohydrolase [Flavobacterium cauense R2A-7]|uniref:Dihydroorotase n=1 Tax=Flavobacterium cauense R2A-7 TaxID=1341154 RepID=V6RWH9_9FLAO|nr:dihydroorotase [Flavobacterium cauense]ESU18524.1 dihydroorotase-like cyclic amidohydrolase [Flavobacterium cauense R2A-7]KGO80612.1 dihydroorotase [Flavobacterium cauense R2A-7]TWI11758.1 dihydroorotase [Flavobacterium cauense R2A-7]